MHPQGKKVFEKGPVHKFRQRFLVLVLPTQLVCYIIYIVCYQKKFPRQFM